MIRYALIAAGLAASVGCLQTRTEMRETEQRQNLSQTVSSLQKENADVGSRFADVNENMRDLRGRIEVLENKMQSANQADARNNKAVADQNQDLNKRVQMIQDTIAKMDAHIQALNADLLAQKAELAAAKAAAIAHANSSDDNAAPAAGKKDTFEVASSYFEKRDWKKAVLEYQQYREKFPKGKKFAEATYRIGVCFQELGMKDEARSFYEEVVSKFPDGGEAKKARTRLKSLKK